MPQAISYVSEAAVVIGNDKIRNHPNHEMRSLPGKTVKVYPETAYDVFFQGNKIGKTVMIVPANVPGDKKPRWILAKYLQSADPAILKLKV